MYNSSSKSLNLTEVCMVHTNVRKFSRFFASLAFSASPWNLVLTSSLILRRSFPAASMTLVFMKWVSKQDIVATWINVFEIMKENDRWWGQPPPPPGWGTFLKHPWGQNSQNNASHGRKFYLLFVRNRNLSLTQYFPNLTLNKSPTPLFRFMFSAPHTWPSTPKEHPNSKNSYVICLLQNKAR